MKIVKWGLGSLLLCMLISLSGNCNAYKHFVNEENSISIDYPDELQRYKSDKFIFYARSPENCTAVMEVSTTSGDDSYATAESNKKRNHKILKITEISIDEHKIAGFNNKHWGSYSISFAYRMYQGVGEKIARCKMDMNAHGKNYVLTYEVPYQLYQLYSPKYYVKWKLMMDSVTCMNPKHPR